ncbi:hypothetical protein GH733_008016, partial [Mirounga leonina]
MLRLHSQATPESTRETWKQEHKALTQLQPMRPSGGQWSGQDDRPPFNPTTEARPTGQLMFLETPGPGEKMGSRLITGGLAPAETCSVHMCSILEHHCAHFCINTPGSYVCRCKQGYILNSDQTTCRSKIALLMYPNHPPLLSQGPLEFICGPSPNQVIISLRKERRLYNS